MTGTEAAPDRQEPSIGSADKPKLNSFTCPSCGGTVELRAIGLSVTAACGSCHALIDVNDERYRLIAKVKNAESIPNLPLGSRGQFGHGLYEVIGYLERSEGLYAWGEYLLFNPYLGFRWLTEVEGHWTFVTMIRDDLVPSNGQSSVFYEGRDYYRYNKGKAQVDYVLGEFYWRIKVGEEVKGTDFICPPFMLSVEESDDETVWSHGVYVPVAEISHAFGVSNLPAPRGAGANQPAPFSASIGSVWKVAMGALFLIVAIAAFMGFARPTTEVYSGTASATVVSNKQTNVLGSFHIPGNNGELSIDTSAQLNNSWIEVNYSLVNKETNESYDFTEALEYYWGSDSDGNWSEGTWSNNDDLSAVPGGDYDLVADIAYGDTKTPPSFTFNVRRNSHSFQPFLIAIALTLIYPIFLTLLRLGFERSRCSNSDYGPTGLLRSVDDD